MVIFNMLIYPFPVVAADIFMVIQEKLKKLLSGDDVKAIQKAVVSLGHMCMMETSSSHLKIATDLIFSLCRSRVSIKITFISGAFLFQFNGV